MLGALSGLGSTLGNIASGGASTLQNKALGSANREMSKEMAEEDFKDSLQAAANSRLKKGGELIKSAAQ
ncbi:hypothetical protein [Caldimonas brevitalea]|uniref:Uncharacterized protein n=1 Tax=Caldimonas brevitalea TaxID=413882 RepID=A0A0G3BKE4_9BURK|nr:hypothetical protein [Caldimonas brevitalea]AKJ27831.1 hypothetical protein AAW51_1140 [Caldimonas brevitalea]